MTFKHSKKWYFVAKIIAKMLGCLFCFLPPLIATFINFPIMVSTNANSTISIVFFLAVGVSLSVLIHYVVKSFKDNALFSVAIVLVGVTAVFMCAYFMEKSTIKGLAWVSGSAAFGILIANACFALYNMWNDLYKNCGEVYVK